MALVCLLKKLHEYSSSLSSLIEDGIKESEMIKCLTLQKQITKEVSILYDYM